VVVSNATGSITNGNAVLHVLDDSVPPGVTAAVTDSAFMEVLFSEEVSPATALELGHYTLRGAGTDILPVALSSNNRIASLSLSDVVCGQRSKDGRRKQLRCYAEHGGRNPLLSS
jgi:hypothetical protein